MSEAGGKRGGRDGREIRGWRMVRRAMVWVYINRGREQASVLGGVIMGMVDSAHAANCLLEWQCVYEPCKHRQQSAASTCSEVSRQTQPVFITFSRSLTALSLLFSNPLSRKVQRS